MSTLTLNNKICMHDPFMKHDLLHSQFQYIVPKYITTKEGLSMQTSMLTNLTKIILTKNQLKFNKEAIQNILPHKHHIQNKLPQTYPKIYYLLVYIQLWTLNIQSLWKKTITNSNYMLSFHRTQHHKQITFHGDFVVI